MSSVDVGPVPHAFNFHPVLVDTYSRPRPACLGQDKEGPDYEKDYCSPCNQLHLRFQRGRIAAYSALHVESVAAAKADTLVQHY